MGRNAGVGILGLLVLVPGCVNSDGLGEHVDKGVQESAIDGGVDPRFATVEGEVIPLLPQDVILEEKQGFAVIDASDESLAKIGHSLHEERKRCGGLMAHSSMEEAEESLNAFAKKPASFAGPTNSFAWDTPVLDQAALVARMQGELREANLVDTITWMSSYSNRHYTTAEGVRAAEQLANEWNALANGRPDVTVSLVRHNFVQPSVEMRIEGATTPDEIVVLGGHLDSVNLNGIQAFAPGADDNASGIAVLTETARVALQAGYRPDRTIIFYGYAGEEGGLLGSQDIANRARAENWDVGAVMQLDMTNFQGSVNDIYMITDNTDPALTTFVSNLAQTYAGLTVGQDRCGYACSDHASWSQAGFPAVMPAEARFNQMNPNIHTTADTIARSAGGAAHAMKFAELAVAFVAEQGKGGIPTVDGGDGGVGETPTRTGDGQNQDSPAVVGGCSNSGTGGTLFGMVALLLALGCPRLRNREA